MALRKNFKYILITAFTVLQTLCFYSSQTTPMNNIQDSCAVYNPQGTNKYYKKLTQPMLLSLDISPYYQSAKGARNRDGRKVELGEIYGSTRNSAASATPATYGSGWNMLAPFFDMGKMTPKNFSSANYPYLSKTNTALASLTPNCADQANYRPDQIDDNTVPNSKNSSIFQVKGEYEKLGLRGKLGFDTKIGLGVSIKSGVADYKIRPNFIAQDPSITPPTPPDTSLTTQLYDLLLEESSRNGIFKELNLDTREIRNTEMEDTHVQLSWQIPFDLKEENETVATIAPWLAVGGWLPSGNKKDYDKAFDLSTGNNGHTGVTAECSINLDFPGTIQIGVGGGALWLQDEDFDNFRLPSNQYQSGFYPWATKVNVDPGMTWYFNVSFKAENFIPQISGFSFFFDFVYTYHEHDDYTVNELSSIKKAYFDSSLKYIKENSSWKSQLVNFGVNYQPTNHLTLGFLVQAPVSGIKVYRSVTSMGTISFTF